MLDIVTAASASVRALTGSSRPGAVPPLVPLDAVRPGLDAQRAAAVHPDAEVIDLAGRVQRLADRHARVYVRMLAITGRIDRWNYANRPERPDEMPSEMTLVRSRTDTHEVTHIEQPLLVLAEREARSQAYEAAAATHEAAVERKRARTREPYLDKLQARMWWRLECWTRALADAEPQTQRGLAAKVVASNAVNRAADDLDWTKDLVVSLGRDALRIISAEADARAEAAQQADGELLALGRTWEASCNRYERACAVEEGLSDAVELIAPPEALFNQPGEAGKLGPYPNLYFPTERYWYGGQRTIDALRRMGEGGVSNPRRDEILLAYDLWRAEVAAENERSGLAAARAERKAATDENAALRIRICLMPASTPAGLDLKLRVILWLHDGLETFAREMEPENIQDPEFSASLALSMVLDFARQRSTASALPDTIPIASAA